MSQFNTITEFNTYLSDKLRNVKLNEYFTLIQSQFYSNVDISFMDYFLELCDNENEFIVDHIKLQEYKVINNLKSSTVLQTLNSSNLIENEDYWVHNVMRPLTGKKGGATSGSKEYKLTPYAFKFCLIRAKNSKEYAKYYLLLEQVFKNYQEYQIMYQKVLLSGKDEKLDEMKQTIDKQSAQIDELLGYAKKTVEQNEELKEQNEELYEKVEYMNDNMEDMKENMEDMKENMEDIKDAFKETADRSVPSPKKSDERHEFILLQHKELINKFKFIRGIQKYNESKITKTYSEYNIIKREFNANPIQLFKQFKESIKENYKLEKAKITANKTLKNKNQLKKEVEKIKFTGNDLELQFDYTLDNLLDKLSEVCNERFTEYNNSCDEE
jgi:chromosome segregation ATPase